MRSYVRRSNGVENDGDEEDGNSRENVSSSALGLNVVSGKHSEKHGRTEEKGNGTGQTISVGKNEHNQTESSGTNTSEHGTANLQPKNLSLQSK